MTFLLLFTKSESTKCWEVALSKFQILVYSRISSLLFVCIFICQISFFCISLLSAGGVSFSLKVWSGMLALAGSLILICVWPDPVNPMVAFQGKKQHRYEITHMFFFFKPWVWLQKLTVRQKKKKANSLHSSLYFYTGCTSLCLVRTKTVRNCHFGNFFENENFGIQINQMEGGENWLCRKDFPSWYFIFFSSNANEMIYESAQIFFAVYF